MATRTSDVVASEADVVEGSVVKLLEGPDRPMPLPVAKCRFLGFARGYSPRYLSRRLEAGTARVYRYGRSRDHILPTGGWKASGLGKDLGREAFAANRRTKSVLIDI